MMAIFGMAGTTKRRESFDLAAFFLGCYLSERRVVVMDLLRMRRDHVALGEPFIKSPNLTCIMCFKYLEGRLQEVKDLDSGFVRQQWQGDSMIRLVNAHDDFGNRLTGGATTLRRGFRWRKDIQVKLLVELSQIALCRSGQQFGGQGGEDAVVAGGMVTQCMSQLRRH
jgi:hypothetical protein